STRGTCSAAGRAAGHGKAGDFLLHPVPAKGSPQHAGRAGGRGDTDHYTLGCLASLPSIYRPPVEADRTFEPGTYALELVGRAATSGDTVLLTRIEFEVGGASARPLVTVPALGWRKAALLVFGVLLIGGI